LALVALLAVQLLLKHGDYPTPKKQTAGKAAPFVFLFFEQDTPGRTGMARGRAAAEILPVH